jgi:hypothetical protein
MIPRNQLEVHRFPDDFEIGDKVRLSAMGEGTHTPFRRKEVTGHDEFGCVLVNVAKPGAKRKNIRPFKPEFIEKEFP